MVPHIPQFLMYLMFCNKVSVKCNNTKCQGVREKNMLCIKKHHQIKWISSARVYSDTADTLRWVKQMSSIVPQSRVSASPGSMRGLILWDNTQGAPLQMEETQVSLVAEECVGNTWALLYYQGNLGFPHLGRFIPSPGSHLYKQESPVFPCL